MPGFAKDSILKEARRQLASAGAAGMQVERLVTDAKAVANLDKLFKDEGVSIIVKYLPK